jgi:hypothetical protein
VTAKEYFNNVRNAIYGRKNLKRNLSDLETKLPTIGSFDYGKDRVQTSPRNVHEERICDYVDSQTKYMKLMQEYTELILEAEERLKQMSRSDYSEILRCLYMGEYRMTYAEVGDQLGYAEATIRNLVSEAYTEFEQLWLTEGKNDQHNNQQ